MSLQPAPRSAYIKSAAPHVYVCQFINRECLVVFKCGWWRSQIAAEVEAKFTSQLLVERNFAAQNLINDDIACTQVQKRSRHLSCGKLLRVTCHFDATSTSSSDERGGLVTILPPDTASSYCDYRPQSIVWFSSIAARRACSVQ